MRSPSAPGTPINADRYREWISRFGSYREGIVNVSIESWLAQFKGEDKDLAARVLDSVEFYGQAQIMAAYKQTLASLPGWNKDASKRNGKWRFAAMSGSAGESGDSMLYQFRLANRLDGRVYNDLFVERSDLFRQRLGEDDVVVLLDDFSGTGKQACDAWNDPVTSYGALLAGVGKVYLVLVAASKIARKRIAEETSMSPVPAHELTDSDSVFSSKCRHFNDADRDKLLRYGQIADKRNPQGYGDCGFVVVFQHRPPNNTIPILHRDNSKWKALFRRHE